MLRTTPRFLSFPYIPFTQLEAAFSIVLIFGTPCEINRAPADVDRLLFRIVKMAWSEVDSLARQGGIVARTELVASFHACTHGSSWPSWRLRAVPRVVSSETCAARRGSVEEGRRMIPVCFARALQRCRRRLCMHCLLTFQEVMPISKTRKQLVDSVSPLATMGPSQAESILFVQAVARRRSSWAGWMGKWP